MVGITDKENGQVPRAFVVLRPGFEETEENVTNLMESRLGVSKVKTIWFPSWIPCTVLAHYSIKKSLSF